MRRSNLDVMRYEIGLKAGWLGVIQRRVPRDVAQALFMCMGNATGNIGQPLRYAHSPV
jgi:hypothetical protein